MHRFPFPTKSHGRLDRPVAPTALLAVLTLTPTSAALSASVAYDLGDLSTYQQHPAFLSAAIPNAQSPLFQVEVDLQAGTLRGLVSAAGDTVLPDAFLGRSAQVMINGVVLTNAGPGPVVTGSPFLTLVVDGQFVFSASGTGAANIYVNALLSAIHQPQAGSAQFFDAGFTVSHSAEQAAAGPISYSSSTPEISTSNGASAVLSVNSPTGGLQARLELPAITLSPNDTLTIDALIFVGVNARDNMSAVTDLFNTASLRLMLPAGTTLLTNATVPLDWVTPVPVPGTASLLGTAVAMVGWRRWRRSHAHAAGMWSS